MMTLLRCVTGESYNGLMHDAMVTEQYSAPGRCSDAEGTCGSRFAPVLFFLSFFILESLVMLNLIVAVVLDSFAEEEKMQQLSLPQDAMEQFVECWKELDREATTYMETKNLRKLLFMLDTPFGFRGSNPPPKLVNEKLASLAIPDRQGKVAFHDVLEAIGRSACGDVELPTGSSAERTLLQKYADVYKSTGMHNAEVSQFSSTHIFNVIRLQAAVRRKKAAESRAKKAREALAAAQPPGTASPNGAANGNSRAALQEKARKNIGGGGAKKGSSPPPSTRKPPSRR